MSLIHRLLGIWRNLRHRRRVEHDLDAELQSVLQLLVEEKLAAGHPLADARRAAAVEIGGVEAIKDNVRDVRAGAVVEGIAQDVRYAIRVLRRSPGFAAVAILSLAFGIGANTAVFSLLNAVVMRELDVRRPDQLVSLNTVRPDGVEAELSFPMFEEIARSQRVFSQLIGYSGDGIFSLEAAGRMLRADIWAVTGNFHSDLGVAPAAGRLLTDRDVNLANRRPEMVAVLGYGIWQREFGGDLSMIGRTTHVEGVPFTVVGIGPRGFTGFGITSEPDITIPITALPLLTAGLTGRSPIDRLSNRKSRWVSVVGRLNDGIGVGEARAHLTSLWPAIRTATMPTDLAGAEREEFLATRLDVTSAAQGRDGFLRSRFTRPLYILLGVAGLVLLIACVNLASLMLSRAAARGHELSVRLALGASRWRLARQSVIEGLVLSVAAACGGLLLAAWSSRALKTMMTRDYLVPAILDVSPDLRVLMFASAVAVLTGVAVSLVPAWRATRQDPAGRLRQSGRSTTGTGRAGKALIVVEVALCLVLLMDSALLVRTVQQLRSTDVGYRRDQITVAGLQGRPDGYRNFDEVPYFQNLLTRVAALPGVRDVALTKIRVGSDLKQRVSAVGGSSDAGVVAVYGETGPQFFRTLDVSLLSGREFAWTDDKNAAGVAIVSRSLAARLFPGSVPIGRRIRIGDDARKSSLEIVGVVADARLGNPRDPNPFAAYVPALQQEYGAKWASLLIRSAGAPVADSELRRVVDSLGREYVLTYRTLHAVADRAILQERVTAILAGFFGVLALGLSAIGLYGLMAYAVTQRTRELGIRLALGARRGEVVGMVVRETMTLVVVGIAIGLPFALAGGRIVRSLLFGLTPGDPVALGGIVMLLLGVGLMAGYLPGRRASRVQPMDALRQ